MMTGLAPI